MKVHIFNREIWLNGITLASKDIGTLKPQDKKTKVYKVEVYIDMDLVHKLAIKAGKNKREITEGGLTIRPYKRA